MLYDNILVPFDGSASADAALEEAARYAKEDPGCALHVLQISDIEHQVIERLDSSYGAAVPVGMREAFEDAQNEAQRKLERDVRLATRGLMNEIHVEVQSETTIGVQIVAYAAAHNIDLIIMDAARSRRFARHPGQRVELRAERGEGSRSRGERLASEKIPHLERTNRQMGDCFFVVPAAGIEPATY